jgi:DNA-directed RNA polymerase specialized sigma24 family protein
MPDDCFLPLFDADPKKAELLYYQFRQKLVFFFGRNHCNDPENLADEVVSRSISAIQQGAVLTTTIQGFCYGIAKNVRLEQLHRPPEDEIEDDVVVLPPRPRHQLNPTEVRILLREYLELLPPDDRILIERYHLEDRKALAVELNKSENALRVEVCRIKRDLLARIEEGPPRDNASDQAS